jgi:HEAT repeats
MLASILLVGLAACGDSAPPESPSATIAPLPDPGDTKNSNTNNTTTLESPPEAALEDASTRGTLSEAASENSTDAEAPAAQIPFTLRAYRELESLESMDAKALNPGKHMRMLSLLLTADITEVPLRTVLAKLAQEIGAKVYIADAVANEPVSVKFDGLPLEEGISQILKGKNYTLIRERTAESMREGDAQLIVAEIRVLSNRDTTGKDTTGPNSRAGGAEGGLPAGLTELKTGGQPAEVVALAKRALKAEDPKDRLIALRGFLDRADRSEYNVTLVPALKDEHPAIRQLALDSIGDGEDSPIEPIAETALTDPKPELRSSALSALVSIHGPAAIPTLEQALADPDARVRRAAQSELDFANKLVNQMQGGAAN